MPETPYGAFPHTANETKGLAATSLSDPGLIVSTARAERDREYRRTINVIKETELAPESTLMLAAKALGKAIGHLRDLTVAELRLVRLFVMEEVQGAEYD